MSATAQLTNQLASLSDSLKQTNALISRLAKLHFQPGSEPLDDEDSNSVRVELAQDIHESLKQLEEDLELLKQEVEDTAAPAHAPSASLRTRSGSVRSNSLSAKVQERERLNTGVVRLGEDLSVARRAFRRAQLSAKKASEAAKTRERELVFASLQHSSDPSTPVSNGDLFAGRKRHQQRQQLSKDELLVANASDLTASLRRTHDLLGTELQRSRFAQETFDQSTETLKELGEKYTDLSGVLGKSRELLGTLLRSQKSDTWYLETAFYILLATLSWLIFRRLLFGPFILLPRFLWNCTAFLLNWILLKPLLLFLSLTGVITSTPYNQSAASNTIGGLRQASTTRAPLIIQPSAEGRVKSMDERIADMMRERGIPAGSGGQGAKVDKYGERGSLSDEIGKMAEKQGEVGSQNGGSGEPQRRGDGTILQERGDVPRNPKKKVFEAEVEDGKEAEGKARRKRDEL